MSIKNLDKNRLFEISEKVYKVYSSEMDADVIDGRFTRTSRSIEDIVEEDLIEKGEVSSDEGNAIIAILNMYEEVLGVGGFHSSHMSSPYIKLAKQFVKYTQSV